MKWFLMIFCSTHRLEPSPGLLDCSFMGTIQIVVQQASYIIDSTGSCGLSVRCLHCISEPLSLFLSKTGNWHLAKSLNKWSRHSEVSSLWSTGSNLEYILMWNCKLTTWHFPGIFLWNLRTCFSRVSFARDRQCHVLMSKGLTQLDGSILYGTWHLWKKVPLISRLLI